MLYVLDKYCPWLLPSYKKNPPLMVLSSFSLRLWYRNLVVPAAIGMTYPPLAADVVDNEVLVVLDQLLLFFSKIMTLLDFAGNKYRYPVPDQRFPLAERKSVCPLIGELNVTVIGVVDKSPFWYI